MRSLILVSGALCAVTLAPVPSAWGGEPASGDKTSQSSTPSTDTVLPAWIQVGGQIRARFESPSGIGFSDRSDDYLLTRLRLNVLVKPTPWLKMFAETQDSRATGYNKPVPSSTGNTLDLRQAYFEVSGEGKQSPMVRVGRQEIQLGGGRLIGLSDWGNWGMMVDGARAAVSNQDVRLDVFTFSPVQADDSRFDRHKAGLHYHGAYLTFGRLFPGSTVEPYYFLKRQMAMTGERGELGNLTLSTVGGRMAGKLPWRLDYRAELARQFGHSARDLVSAMAGNYMVGWTVSEATWKPRVSAEFSHASGDKSNKDGHCGTFDQLQAANHWNYGTAELMGWRNMQTVRAGFDTLISKKLKLETDWNDFFLATVQDGLYVANGTRNVLNRNATSRHVGNELDLIGSYQHNKGLVYGAGMAHLFAGEYLKQSTAGHDYWIPYVFCIRTF
jgi:hypothetical protein